MSYLGNYGLRTTDDVPLRESDYLKLLKNPLRRLPDADFFCDQQHFGQEVIRNKGISVVVFMGTNFPSKVWKVNELYSALSSMGSEDLKFMKVAGGESTVAFVYGDGEFLGAADFGGELDEKIFANVSRFFVERSIDVKDIRVALEAWLSVAPEQPPGVRVDLKRREKNFRSLEAKWIKSMPQTTPYD